MAKCGACGRFLASTEGASCDKCKSKYHRDCVGINTKTSLTTPWHCPECKKDLVRDNRADTPVRGQTQMALKDSQAHFMETSPINNADGAHELTSYIKVELKRFKDDFISTVRNEFQLLRNDLSELRSELKATNDRMSNLEERVSAIEKQKQVQTSAKSDVHEIIAQLRSDINDRDQELLSTDIQISNLLETTGENPMHTAILVATKIGLKIEARDIVSSERIGGRRINATQPAATEPRPRILVVRLARRDLRNDFLSAARVRRGMTSADLGLPGPSTRFYVNERLTKQNRELFRKAREVGGRLGWQFIWSKRGRILARHKPADSAFPIRCEADILRVFGHESATDVQKVV